jgi:hypothetical protein
MRLRPALTRLAARTFWILGLRAPTASAHLGLWFGLVALLVSSCTGAGGLQPGPRPHVGSRPQRICASPCDWRPIPLPRLGVSTGITGMLAFSRDDAWVAALSGPGWTKPEVGPDASWVFPNPHVVMLHRTANGWRRLPMPSGVSAATNLTASAPDNVWALAEDQSNKLLHWDGQRWSLVTPQTRNLSLQGLAVISADDVWAVGAAFTKTGSYAIADHWNGRRWQLTRFHGLHVQLTAAAGSGSDNVWAFGGFWHYPDHRDSGNYDRSGYVILHWNGEKWQTAASRVYHDTKLAFNFQSASMLDDQDGWAVGARHPNSSGGPLQMVARWDGHAWRLVPTPDCCRQLILRGVAASAANTVWAAGYGGANEHTHTVAFRWDGRQWQMVPTPTGGSAATIAAVDVLPDGTTIIAGTTPNSNGTEYPLLEQLVRQPR